MGEIKRIYPEEPWEINESLIETSMDVNMPMFMIGFKDEITGDKLKDQIAVEIVVNSLLGKCSETYQDMYNEGLIMTELEMEYEFSRNFAHLIIAGESKNPKRVEEIVLNTFENKEVTLEEFERSKKKIYGDYTSEYNSVDEIGRMFLQDAVKGYNSIDYLNKLEEIDLEYVNDIRNKLLNHERHALSIVKGK